MMVDFLIESELTGIIAGVDEAGRGPLAGPVVAAAVILDPKYPIDGLADSKKLFGKPEKPPGGTYQKTCVKLRNSASQRYRNR